MDTEFLESLLMVIDHGSVAEAARRLGISPTAVAQRIGVLEEQVGTRLVARVGRTVKPTVAGAAVVERARDIVRDVEDLRAVASAGRVEGEFKLGATSSAIIGLLPPVLKRLASKHPGLELHVTPGASTALYEKLLANEIDAALLVEPPFPLGKAYSWSTVRIDPYVFLAAATLKDTPPRELVRGQPFIRYDRKVWGGRLADTWLRSHRYRPTERFELDALDAIAVLVDQGLGVSLVPDWHGPWPEGIRLAKIPVPVDPIYRKTGFLWPRNSLHLRQIETLVAEALGAFRVSTLD
ncbi:LysR family transcriptional regulator [Bordetella sp. LUAb4]|uniref:LysR family transcriptional regulator n=1 Tax=Bordetella sp. LUAb4 TaxID=2843195 RepID=UPI001E2EF827|nr:LysR family transcriptional regulator [Bordetella sp. LUAb4]